MLRSADYLVVLESIEADARRSEEAAWAQLPPAVPVHLIVQPGAAEASSALELLRRWLRGAKHVIICDPYFFSPPRNSSLFTSDEDYGRRLLHLFDPSTKHIQIFCNHYTERMKRQVWRPLKEGRRVQIFSSTNIHDRFIIKDGVAGKMIGASMQGFGGKIFAILDMPSEDVVDLVKALRQIAKISKRPWQ